MDQNDRLVGKENHIAFFKQFIDNLACLGLGRKYVKCYDATMITFGPRTTSPGWDKISHPKTNKLM